MPQRTLLIKKWIKHQLKAVYYFQNSHRRRTSSILQNANKQTNQRQNTQYYAIFVRPWSKPSDFETGIPSICTRPSTDFRLSTSSLSGKYPHYALR
jgi:hypothetical protein